MVFALSAYVALGALLAALWNLAEFGRSSVWRLLPRLALIVLLWPALALGAALLTIVWTHIWRRLHREDPESTRPATPCREPKAILAEDTPAPV